MPILNVKLPQSKYNIHIIKWNLDLVAREIKTLVSSEKIFIITNKTIAKLYQQKIQKAFSKSFDLEWLVIPDGEQFKTLNTCEKLHETLSRKGAHRKSTLIALGGGVVGDITGFVAATYMRGIDFIQMPTTLLAQVDSSVGGKTGVDLKTGKNLVGAFHQPRAVFILTDFLKTLPTREFKCGLAEVIKYGIIWDATFFTFLEKNAPSILKLDAEILTHLIATSCLIKTKIVQKDEKEANLRAILNFGHTLGHALETTTGYKTLKHGEAVALGMLFALRLSNELGLTQKDLTPRLDNLLAKLQISLRLPKINITQVMTAISTDKKITSKNIRFILIPKLGKSIIKELDLKVVQTCLKNHLT